MKKAIVFVVIIGMLGWAVYDFAFQENDGVTSKANNGEQQETKPIINQEEETTDEKTETQQEATIGLNVGNIAPDFQLETLIGEQVKLSDYKGKRVMLNFWATWCPPCRAEMPDIEKFHQNKDVIILAVNLTQTEPSTQQIKDFVNEYNLTFPILLDKQIQVANTYGIRPIPTSFMIDSKGLIQHKTFGPMTYESMVEQFEKME